MKFKFGRSVVFIVGYEHIPHLFFCFYGSFLTSRVCLLFDVFSKQVVPEISVNAHRENNIGVRFYYSQFIYS